MIPGLTATSQTQVQPPAPKSAPRLTLRLTAVVENPPFGPPPAINPARAIANVSFHERLSNTVRKMQASSLFSKEQKEAISQWKEKFDAGFSKTLEGGNINVSLALGALICTVIHPALKENPEKAELENFELLLTFLLSKSLPPKNDLNAFITLCQKYFEKQAFVEKQMAIIERVFQEATDEVFERANSLNAEIERNFLELEALLGNLNAARQEEMEALHEEEKNLTGEAEAHFKELQSFRSNQLTQQAKLKAVKDKYLQFLEASKATLKRLS